MPILKDFLQEELKNSKDLKKAYENELKKIPKGALVKKQIKGHDYHYLAYKQNGKVHYIYKGKLPQKELHRYLKAKKRRAQIRPLLSQVKKQIHFLKKVLNDRQLQSMP